MEVMVVLVSLHFIIIFKKKKRKEGIIRRKEVLMTGKNYSRGE